MSIVHDFAIYTRYLAVPDPPSSSIGSTLLIKKISFKTTEIPLEYLPSYFQILLSEHLVKMKASSTTALLLFASSFASAWKFNSDAQEFVGVGNQLCFSLTHRGAATRNVKYYSWDRGFIPPGARPTSQESCCLVLYDTDTCKNEGNSDRVCKREVAGESVLNKVEGFKVEGLQYLNHYRHLRRMQEWQKTGMVGKCGRECRDREGGSADGGGTVETERGGNAGTVATGRGGNADEGGTAKTERGENVETKEKYRDRV